MYSVGIWFTPTQNLQHNTGFKSVAIATDRRQYIENAIGFKGVCVGLDDLRGFAIKIKHFKIYTRGVTPVFTMTNAPEISPSNGAICFNFVLNKPLTQNVQIAFNWYANRKNGTIIPLDSQNTTLYASSAKEFKGCLSGYSAEAVDDIDTIYMEITNVSPPLLIFQNPIITTPVVKP